MTTLSRKVAGALLATLHELAADPDLRCLVLRGSGKSFVVGADIKEIGSLSVEDNLAYNETLIAVNHAVAAMPVPVVACINGHALGGGLELALACSVRIAAETARMGLPEVRIGIVPGAGGTIRLPRLLPRGAALKLLTTGAMIDAAEALRIGLVDEVVPAQDAPEAANRLAQSIAASAPLAVRTIVAAVRALDDAGDAEAIARVHGSLELLVRSDDHREGIAAFLDKRAAVFTGS
ncbi:MAG: enoyl-CoA hydratase [Solirubrobacteraceae bacterium]|nr:enoyl-CoA hydratase [Solirubrobacteraceae bacterium]